MKVERRADGTELLEGAAAELAEYVNKTRWVQAVNVPSLWTTNTDVTCLHAGRLLAAGETCSCWGFCPCKQEACGSVKVTFGTVKR